MTLQSGNHSLPLPPVYVNISSLMIVSIGIAVLVGWFFDIALLRSILPGLATMKANTALCFVFAGSSLWLLQSEAAIPAKKRIGKTLAGLVIAIGLLTMSQYVFNWDMGIDQLLLKDQITPANLFPGRMSQVTALCFILCGLSLLLLDSTVSQYFSIGVFAFSLVALIGYLFDFESLYRLAGYSSIAIHTAFTFFIFSLALLASRPSRGMMKTLTSDLPGSRMMRLLLPTIAVGTLLLGWLLERGESVGLLEPGSESAVLVVLLILVYSPLIYLVAKNLNEAEGKLRESEARFRAMCDFSPIGIFLTAPDGFSMYANIVNLRQMGLTSKEAMGSGWQRAIHPEDRADVFAGFADAVQQRIVYQGINRYLHADGRIVWVDVNAAAIRDGERIVGFVGTATDITKRKQAEEQLERQLKRLSGLRMVDIAISSSFDLHFILDIVLQQVLSQLRVDAAAILLFNSQLQKLEYAASRGFRSNALHHTQLQLGEGYAGRVMFEQKTIHIPSLMETGGKLATALQLANESFVEYYGTPLIFKGEVRGVLEIYHRFILHTDPEWLEFLEMLAGQAAIAIDSAQLFVRLQHSNFELGLAYDATIEGWSRAMDLRDKETEGHTLRVTDLTVKLAKAMNISEPDLIHIRRGALLHDMGKLGVPDNILLKSDDLTAEEWEIMRKHPQFAYDMLSEIHYLQPALDIPYCHHEKWDGTGYPRNLKGNDIPLAARIFAIADVWDALTSERPYRRAWSKEETSQYIKDQSGKHFDPQVVKTFLMIIANE